ncbi:MAG TPA: protocatechuate 3,4-dioxygenase subunit beta [Usitatibacter sp.]|jgi:protocatechuate 3,4-dioxygenase beta subunit|nr:protocatechuate 3,4-dioxygenase subunit beta [Usitatibacter sp.]
MNDMTKPRLLDPPYDYPDYGSTHKRFPREALVELPKGALDTPGPLVPAGFVHGGDNDLTTRGKSAPLGEKMILVGRLVDEDGRPVRSSLVEIWQANASGRYHHPGDQHEAPLDPNFEGIGRTFTDDEGVYRFVTVKPGSYPWRNHPYAWRPQHIHFSLLGNAPVQRLITQMYFPGDPLLEVDPVYNSVPDADARKRMICTLDLKTGIEQIALGYRFDIVLAGAKSTPMGI